MIALGQTVFWDEPMKAVLLDALQKHAPANRLILSVMDTDFFAKAPLEETANAEYRLLPHNDTTTQSLWVATGELSRLFGCEMIPRRSMYHAHGVRIEEFARGTDHPNRTLDEMTEAWGWKGLAHTGSRRMLAGEALLADVLPLLEEQLQWGFSETARALVDPPSRERAEEASRAWIDRIRAFADRHPGASLTDLYVYLLPFFCAALPGDPPDRHLPSLDVTTSMALFRFNRRTANLPSFQILDLFLRRETGEGARRAYNDAVRDSDIYTLDRFPMGAIPFDLVIPGLGRGTIRILPERVIIEMEERIFLRLEKPIDGAADLASVIEGRLGRGTSIVGKAVTLIAMLARIGPVVLNETGSNYVWRTRRMIHSLCERGIACNLYPIVRLQYPTWDTMDRVPSDLRLPAHLADAFGTETLSTAEFSRRWRQVREDQAALLREASRAVRPRDEIDFLSRHRNDRWTERLAEFDACRDTLKDLSERLDEIGREAGSIRSEIRALRAESNDLLHRKGRDFRLRIQPLREALWQMEGWFQSVQSESGKKTVPESASANPAVEAIELLRTQMVMEDERRRQWDRRWEELRGDLHARRERLAELNRRRESLLREDAITGARRRLAEIRAEAQVERLAMVRTAYLTVEGLEHTDYRPAAWWLLLLSPEGDWFRSIRDRTQAYLEPLSCRDPVAPGGPSPVISSSARPVASSVASAGEAGCHI